MNGSSTTSPDADRPLPPTPRLCLLGTPRLLRSSGEIRLERKDALLIAWLALEGSTPRARLARLLYPDADESGARNDLRQRLFRLRKTGAADLIVGAATLQLAEGVAVDLADDYAPGELLADAEADDLPELAEWLARQRERRGRARGDALAAAAARAEAEGELERALEAAQAIIELDPLAEAAHRRVMRLHYALGDRGAAVAAYARCREALERGLGAAPSAETEALRRQFDAPSTAVAAHPAAPRVLLPPRLVGRDAEWAALNEAWEARSAAIVVGEPGMGKTRLLTDLANARGDALRVASRPGDVRVPFALLSRLVRGLVKRCGEGLGAGVLHELARLLPELGEAEPMKSSADRARFVNAVEALLHAAPARGIHGVIVDDLHYADAASMELLQHLAGAEDRLAWLAAYRPAEVAPEAAGLVDELMHARRAATHRLQPLAVPQVAELIASLGIADLGGARLAADVARHTGGNPMYILETLKLVLVQGAGALAAGPLPVAAGISALIERRLAQLSAEALRLARCAAVAGQDFSPELAAHALGARPLDLADGWNELERAQVFRDGAFAHDLIYEAALASVPAPIARELHGVVGQYLQARGGSAAHAAAHFEAAGREVPAAELWVAAGREMQAALRFVEAADAFERAAALFARGMRLPQGFDAALLMRKACYEIDLAERSERALQLLEQLASTPVHQALASSERAETSLARGDLPATERHALEGLRQLGGADEPLLRAELRRSLAAIHAWRGEAALALAELRSIQHDIERLGSPAQRFELLQSLAIVLDHNDQTEEAIQRYQQATDLALASHNIAGAAQCALNLSLAQHDVGDLGAAQVALERGRALLAALPDEQRSYSSFDLNSGLVARGLGDYTRALEHFDRAITRARQQTPGWLPLMVAHRAQALLYVGQHARAHYELRQVAPGEATPPLARTKWQMVQEQLDRQLGKSPDQALAELIELQPRSGRRLTTWRLRAVGLARAQDAAAQLAQAEQLLDTLRSAGRMGLVIHVGARAARLATELGQHDAAARHARRTLELFGRFHPDDIYPGEVLYLCWDALRRAGAPDQDSAFERAIGWVRATAAERVPAEFRDSFLYRNVVNRELLAHAARLVE